MIVDDRIAIAEGRRVDAARLAVGRKFLLADPSQPAWGVGRRELISQIRALNIIHVGPVEERGF